MFQKHLGICKGSSLDRSPLGNSAISDPNIMTRHISPSPSAKGLPASGVTHYRLGPLAIRQNFLASEESGGQKLTMNFCLWSVVPPPVIVDVRNAV